MEAFMQTLIDRAARIGALLTARGEKLSVAESSAGGLVSAALLSIPGASAWFLGGAVVYTTTARAALLGITPEMLAGLRPSTEPYARLLAETLRGQLDADWGLGETGATGPTGNRYGDAAGHACLAVVGPRERCLTIETGHGDRAANMRHFAAALLDLMLECLEQAGANTTGA
jgi:nicotinamide-nucleotide amidase